MKKLIALVLTFVFALTLSLSAALADPITIAVPSDPTNEGRALLLLQKLGVLTLKEDAGLEATKLDIASTAVEIELVEVEAALLPEFKINADVDYAIINNNYALQSGLNPVTDSLAIEDADSPYVNVVSVASGNEDTDAAKALAAALTSQQVADYINSKYEGAAIATIENPTDGYDPTVDYDALAGTTISIAATAVPHEEVLKDVVAGILAEKGIELEVISVSDYITPNTMVNEGDVFANYFAHQPYQDSFNAENGTNLVTIAGVHVEPMALYGGIQESLDALQGK